MLHNSATQEQSTTLLQVDLLYQIVNVIYHLITSPKPGGGFRGLLLGGLSGPDDADDDDEFEAFEDADEFNEAEGECWNKKNGKK